jgi:hypothetical protein
MHPDDDIPDHHDADIVIKLYDLRREPVMRESRATINAKYWPASAEEATAPMQRDHPMNAAWRQVSNYWEMVFGMGHHGIVHADYLVENSSEGLSLFARVEPYLAALRTAGWPRLFQHAEWAANETATGRAIMEPFRARVKQRLGER